MYEGEPFLVINNERICKNCVDNEWQYASIEDSSYYDYIDNEINEEFERGKWNRIYRI